MTLTSYNNAKERKIPPKIKSLIAQLGGRTRIIALKKDLKSSF
jgi:hypothetical protein